MLKTWSSAMPVESVGVTSSGESAIERMYTVRTMPNVIIILSDMLTMNETAMANAAIGIHPPESPALM
jgi:hypothetical protein